MQISINDSDINPELSSHSMTESLISTNINKESANKGKIYI